MGGLSRAGRMTWPKSVSQETVLDHEALLTLARKVSAAASDGDIDHLRSTATDFEKALEKHLQRETATMHCIPPAEERILERGQERLWSATVGLLWDANHGCPHPPGYCSSRAEELLALLTLQAHDEGRALRGHVAREREDRNAGSHKAKKASAASHSGPPAGSRGSTARRRGNR